MPLNLRRWWNEIVLKRRYRLALPRGYVTYVSNGGFRWKTDEDGSNGRWVLVNGSETKSWEMP